MAHDIPPLDWRGDYEQRMAAHARARRRSEIRWILLYIVITLIVLAAAAWYGS